MQLSDYQNTIMLDRYAKRDKDNKPTETKIEQIWSRVANEIGNDDTERKAFYALLSNFKFVPGGRVLAGAGTESEKTYYNCFVIPVETRARRNNRTRTDFLTEPDNGSDSREAIFDTISTMVDIMSRGGGVGINWSVLRPAKSYLTRVSGTSSGPVGWMDVASKAVGEVIQGGSRRGAAMFMMDDWHPDVLKFVEAKKTPGVIENANISVAVSDEFMEAVRSDAQWDLVFPDTTDPEYNTLWDGDIKVWVATGHNVRVHATVRARDLWATLSESAHASGEPGVVFLGRYNAQSTGRDIERIISVNPCGEQGLGAYSVCNLGSINLAAYVYPSSPTTSRFDWDAFEHDTRVSIRFMDNVIDKTHYLHEDTKRVQQRVRRVGLGVMGLADALIMLGLRYGHSDAVAFTERVFRTMKDNAIEASMDLAIERGPAGAWSDDMWERPYLREYVVRNDIAPFGASLRNLFLLTQAPTGTTAALAGVYSGIEPYFSFTTTRIDRTGTHNLVADIATKYAGSPALVTSNDVSVREHLVMQAAAQKYIDSSVSKTVNAPKDATLESVAEAFDMAWDLGLKGFAYYRDGSRDKQVLYRDDPNKKIRELEAKIAWLEQRPSGAGSPNLDIPALPMLAFADTSGDGCPVCSSQIIFAEGCQKCSSCSWSAC